MTVEINGSNGAMRIGTTVAADPSAGSLTLGSHVILNADSTVVPNNTNRPSVGRRGMLRFNDTNNSAEIFDGSNWADVGYYAGLPLGAIIAYPSETPPNDTFLRCNGGSLSRSTYTDLFNLIGSVYGPGTDTIGTTTFALPDIQGRTIVGKSSAGTFTTLNQKGGTETVQLDITQIPSHQHTVGSVSVSGSGSVSSTFTGTSVKTEKDGKHSHTLTGLLDNKYWTEPAWNGPGNQRDNRYYNNQTVTTTEDAGHTHSFTASGSIVSTLTLNEFNTAPTNTGFTGGAGSHNNLQPYIVLNYYIKATKESKRYASALVSDARVKYNVRDMDSKEAMNAILSLQPKRYEYVDKTISDFEKHVGFIAQETKYCIPESVRTKRDFIPNVYSMAKVVVYNENESSSILLTSVQKPITNIITDELKEQVRESKKNQTQDGGNAYYSLKGVKLKLFNRAKQPFCVVCIESVDDYNILVENCNNQSMLKSDEYFVYGQEVEDYHYMNNDAIFSTLVSAFQELGISEIVGGLKIIRNFK
jgi:microcystin-dependent protein